MMDLEALGTALEPTRFELVLADRDCRLHMTVVAAESRPTRASKNI
jgi:hypothetical protein